MEKRRIDLSKVDLDGLHDPEIEALKRVHPPADMPFKIGKMGHAVLVVCDIDVSVRFYTQVLGFKVSDVYPDSMVKGRMVFMRFNEDHHGLGLVGQGGETSRQRELHHIAFEVATIDEVFRARDHLAKKRRADRFSRPATRRLSGVGRVSRPRWSFSRNLLGTRQSGLEWRSAPAGRVGSETHPRRSCRPRPARSGHHARRSEPSKRLTEPVSSP